MPLLCPPSPAVPAAARPLLAGLEERGLDGHALRVAALAQAVARRLGLSERAVAVVALAGLLHDVGKLAIPSRVLDHPGRLSDRDWALMRDHAVIGQRTLARCPGLEGLGVLVRHSHERWDGLGYPDGLEGELIPLGSRIITACDAWDAMRSQRCYQPARSTDEALSALVAGAGAQFDTAVVAALTTELMASGRA